jgi:polysaccharide biosynthesis protein PelD
MKASQSKSGGRASGAVVGIPVAALVEIALLLGAALLCDTLFLDGTRFRSLPQHPFWIPVLLVAVQYGTNAGLAAATAATLALLAGNLPPQAVFQDRFAWFSEVVHLPLMWFIAAVVLGELRMRQIRERQALREQLAETSHRENVLAEAYKRLIAAKEALETRLAGQMRTSLTLYEAAKGIEKLDPSEVLLGVSKLVKSIMNPEKFSLYLVRNDSLELALAEGWTSGDGYPRRYGPGSRIFHEAVGGQRVLSVANPDDEFVLAGEGLIAAPLMVPDSGRVAGMLKIEKLGFLDLNFSNVKTFQVLCQWIGAAYENAVRYQTACSDRVVNRETELLAFGFLSRQLAMLRGLAKRIGFDVSMIVVRLENEEELTPEQRTLAPLVFSRTVPKVLRRTDLAFDYRRTGSEFVLVLPATTVEGARAVIAKLESALREELAGEGVQALFSFGAEVIYDTGIVEQPVEELIGV